MTQRQELSCISLLVESFQENHSTRALALQVDRAGASNHMMARGVLSSFFFLPCLPVWMWSSGVSHDTVGGQSLQDLQDRQLPFFFDA